MMKQTLFLLFFAVSLLGYSDVFPDKPTNYITDEANIISDAEELALNKKLHAFEDSTGIQIFVYVANSLNGEELEPISQRIFHQWGIGQKGNNNGVLISIFVNDHKFRIHTGYGMEASLPDLLTKRIQDEYMRPLFKQNDYAGGINAGVDKLIYYSEHDFKTEEDAEATKGLILIYAVSLIPLGLLFWLMLAGFRKFKALKLTILIIASVMALIPVGGIFVVTFMLVFMSIVALIRKVSKTTGGGGNWSSGNDNSSSWSSWSSSSSSDSSWSSSDSSSDFGGGGGGDSGGGGSNSDW